MTMTVAQWCIEHRAPYVPVFPAHMGYIYGAPRDGRARLGLPSPVLIPESYLAQINGGVFVTPSEVVFANGTPLTDPRCAGRDLWFDKVVPEPHGENHLETGILLQDTHDVNYGHFLMEVLPRLALLHDVPLSVPLLVGRNVLGIPQLAQALDLCAPGRPVTPTEVGGRVSSGPPVRPGGHDVVPPCLHPDRENSSRRLRFC